MAKKLERCVKNIMNHGKNKSSAYAICNSSLKKKKTSSKREKK
jgi:ribosomal protein S7